MTTLVIRVASAGPIYTWQDDQGQVHFSDRPLAGEDQSQPTNIQTQVSDNQDATASDRYSIRQQIEYFDQKREQQRQANLEERRLRQEARMQELEERRLKIEQERAENPEPETVIVNQYPRYRPRYHRGPYHRPRGIQTHSPYMLQYEYLDDHNRFNLGIGNRYPSYPLNYWRH
jgi:hypothetical protein